MDWNRACFTLDKVAQNCDTWTQNSFYGLWDIFRCIHIKYLLFFVRICLRQWLRPLSNFMMKDWSTEKTKWSIGLASCSLWFQILRWIDSCYCSVVVQVNVWFVERLYVQIPMLANFSTLVLRCFSLDKFWICMDYVQILWSIVHVNFLMLKTFMNRLIYWKIISRLRIYIFPREPKSTFPGIRRKCNLEPWPHLHIQWWAKVRDNEFGRNLCFFFIMDFNYSSWLIQFLHECIC